MLAPVNPFKDATMRREFAAAVANYNARHRTLFLAPDRRRASPNYGSAWAQFFWRGYDGETRAWTNPKDATFRRMIGFAHYRAGQAIRKLDNQFSNQPTKGL